MPNHCGCFYLHYNNINLNCTRELKTFVPAIAYLPSKISDSTLFFSRSVDFNSVFVYSMLMNCYSSKLHPIGMATRCKMQIHLPFFSLNKKNVAQNAEKCVFLFAVDFSIKNYFCHKYLQKRYYLQISFVYGVLAGGFNKGFKLLILKKPEIIIQKHNSIHCANVH